MISLADAVGSISKYSTRDEPSPPDEATQQQPPTTRVRRLSTAVMGGIKRVRPEIRKEVRK